MHPLIPGIGCGDFFDCQNYGTIKICMTGQLSTLLSLWHFKFMSGILFFMFFCSKTQKEFMEKYQKRRAEKIESSVWSAQSDVLFGQSFGASSCYKRGEKKD